MASQITVRLPEDLKESLELAAARAKVKSSEVVRMALRDFLGTPKGSRPRAAERVRGLVGSLASGIPDLAEKHRKYVLESLKNGR